MAEKICLICTLGNRDIQFKKEYKDIIEKKLNNCLNDNRDEYLDDLEKLLDEVPLSDFSLNLNHKLHNLYQQVGDKKKADEYWQDYWIQKSKLRERDKKYYQQAIGLYEQLLGKQVNEIEVLENEIKRNITIWVVVLLILWVIIFPIIKMKYLK